MNKTKQIYQVYQIFNDPVSEPHKCARVEFFEVPNESLINFLLFGGIKLYVTLPDYFDNILQPSFSSATLIIKIFRITPVPNGKPGGNSPV